MTKFSDPKHHIAQQAQPKRRCVVQTSHSRTHQLPDSLLLAARFAWNPFGTGLALEEFTFPIMLLHNDTAPQAVGKAAHNAQRVSLMPSN